MVGGTPALLHGECADMTAQPALDSPARIRRMLEHVGAIAKNASGSPDSTALRRFVEVLERVRDDWSNRPAIVDNWLSGIIEDATELFNTPELSGETAQIRRECIAADIQQVMKRIPQ